MASPCPTSSAVTSSRWKAAETARVHATRTMHDPANRPARLKVMRGHVTQRRMQRMAESAIMGMGSAAHAMEA